ncbi:MAG: acetyl-CoA carboxylase, biotin carboxyl carrier protein [Candidatus Coatesbacteria bacterium RBG_13_66_14]|uniref:Biotin carboxyl carrier protein of acetyl-CoA carboxylase n=1 Tax=Candidatus Coatesbacteria bacterium RBG_13_66_14 TaxID=1817816 RepID=A0A1F5FJL1_9BACT|nr:MAG: acetyl-CoA carboxylase, biotin carboxyl carrier protein [Candidatus Coatesbacteria bacterium RBG_13_66_14]
MDLEKLRKIIELFNEGGLTGLVIKGDEDGFEELELKKELPAESAVAIPVAPPSAAPLEPEAPAPAAPAPLPESGEELVYVVAPLVGTFYTAPSPESPVYVKVGDRVDKGTVVCIVEAMKVMNEIESEYAGTIVKVMVQNAQPVEYGQRMFAIKPG